ncbi:PucR family transcriptional regulator [Paraliobacillus sp. X-1268]|uniref:PucR family transcriptional regulator n=1 Tax=Paraliobacillus sp. X-1268 TaxID=2213193 RepID=UPI000E3D2A9E|nr:PucR family transcriptional regulator [Paraliobacillus sp. X-1268]
MGLLAQEILELSIFESSTIKAGETNLVTNNIEWVSVIESPVENFVRKNEFVLTTGIGCKNDPEALETFVKDIIQSGASVLAFATGRYVFDIPSNLLQIANQSHLILIDIPWEVRFGDIVANIMQKITADKQDEREEAEIVRQQLVNCVLNDKGLQDIAQVLYKYVHLPLAISDNQFSIRANRSFSNEWLTPFQTELKYKEKTSKSDLSVGEHPLYYLLEAYQVKEQTIYYLPVINNHKIQGYLLVQSTQKKQLSWFVMNVLEHALTACALYFVKENAIELTEVRLKDNFVLQLAQQKVAKDNHLIAKADLLGYDLTYYYICLVGDLYYREAIKQYDNDRSENSSLQSQNYAIQKEITYAGELFSVKTMTTFDAGKVIIFLEATPEAYMEIANQFLDKVERRVSELLKGIVISWGIAAPEIDDYSFSDAYRKAKIALEIGIEQGGYGNRTMYEDTKVDRLLMALSDQPEVKDIVKQTLNNLLIYDQKRQTDLVHTFSTYNQYKGNVSQTARALNLHRQSLLHRLRNIETLTKLSLVDSDDAFLLELSVRIWKLQQVKNDNQ